MVHLKRFFLILILCIIQFTSNSQYQIVQPYKFFNSAISNVSSIVKDKNNFIWISTQGGVYRFDAVKYSKVYPASSIGKDANWICTKLIYDSATSELFMVCPLKGIARILQTSDTLQFEAVISTSEIKLGEFINFCPLKNGYLITGTRGMAHIEFSANTESSNHIKKRSVISAINPIIFEKTSENEFYIINNRFELITYRIPEDNSFKIVRTVDLLPTIGIDKEIFCTESTDSFYYIGTSAGLIQLNKNQEDQQDSGFILANKAVYALSTDNQNNLLIATNEGLYVKKISGKIEGFKINSTETNDDLLEHVYYLYYENSGNLWLGTQNGLAYIKNSSTPFFQIKNTTTGEKKLNHVYQINDFGNEVIISSNNGLYALNESKELKSLLNKGSYFLSFKDPNNKHIVSDINSTFVLERGILTGIEKIYPEFIPYPNLSFNDYETVGDSLIFLSTENNKGVYCWNYKKKILTKLGGDNQHIIGQNNGIYVHDKKLHILTDTSIITHDLLAKSVKQSKIFNKEKTVHYELFFDLVALKNGYYLSSYGNGIIHTDFNFNTLEVYNSSKGLSNNYTYRIINLSDSLLFISTNNGLNLFNPQSKKFRLLFADDGLHDNTFEEFSALKKNNLLYFGGKNGLTEINTALFNESRNRPNIKFLSCKTIKNDNSEKEINLQNIDELTITSNTIQTSIYFQNIDYPFDNKVIFQYRISELNDQWIALNNQNFITFTGIKPGTYKLQIRAGNESGIYSDTKQLILHFLPKWYQTWWFKSLILVAIFGTVYALYRLRINQLKKEARIRNEIAVDLHDELGSTLSSVSMYTNMANKKTSDEGIRPFLGKIGENTQIAIRDLKDIIWILDDKKNTIHDLLHKLKQFFIPLCEANGIKYTENIDDQLPEKILTKAEKRNLYMILKECLNNSLKYSGCQHIKLEWTEQNRKKSITISDDGKGFDMKNVPEGRGLVSLRLRSEKIRYSSTVDSQPGSGTTIHLREL